MVKTLTAAWVILLFTVGVCFAEGPAFKTEKDKVSYVIGMLVGKDMAGKGVDVNADVFVKGFRDGLSGAKPAMSEAEAQSTMAAFNKEMAAKKQAQAAKAVSDNKKAEEAFMAENAKKEGVKTLPSGLQYKVFKEGTGAKPTLYDKVTVNYRGTLLNGTEFDSSYKRNAPATFPVNGVIRGWSEALQLMKTGSKWEIYVPSRLAYGDAGAGGVIPPGAALIFDVELLSVNSQPAAQGAKPAGGAGK